MWFEWFITSHNQTNDYIWAYIRSQNQYLLLLWDNSKFSIDVFK